MQPSAPGTAPVVEGNLPSSAAQLPPAPPALAIPPNTNPIPTAITSPQSIPAAANGGDVMTPVTAGGAANVGRRPQVKSGNRTLYVGGLPGNCTEEQLTKIFGSLNKGSVASVKLIPDKNVHSKGLYYGFVEFDDPAAAEHAMLIMNGRKIYEREIRINWAYQTNTTHKEDTSSHFHIFVGDLSNEVTDEALLQAFQTFGDVSEARVMWDMKTGRTRGYGFVAYRSQEGAVRAISEMDGEWLGSRQIRVNWANQKGQPSMAQSQAMAHAGVMPAGMPAYGQTMIDPAKQQANYTTVYNGAPMNVVTVYVGNLTPFTTNQDLHPLFSNFGNIVEIRYQQDRGYAFIKYGTHDEAATAILNLNSYVLNGRPLKCSVSSFSLHPSLKKMKLTRVVATSGVVIANLTAIPPVVLTVVGPLRAPALIQVTATTRLPSPSQRQTPPTRTPLLVLTLLTASTIPAILCHHKVFTILFPRLIVTRIGNHTPKQECRNALGRGNS